MTPQRRPPLPPLTLRRETPRPQEVPALWAHLDHGRQEELAALLAELVRRAHGLALRVPETSDDRP